MTNDKARVTARCEYDPYGARKSHPATSERYGFVGNEPFDRLKGEARDDRSGQGVAMGAGMFSRNVAW